MNTLIKADVVGSLLRPEYLKQAHTDLKENRISILEFKRIEDRAVDAAIKLQEEADVDVVTDGEMRRFLFTGSLTEAVEGIEQVFSTPVEWSGEGEEGESKMEDTQATLVTGKLRRVRSLIAEEFAYARARTTKPIKMTLPSPLMMAFFWNPEHSKDAYPDPFDLFSDSVELLKEEVRELHALGCEHIQFDAPELGTLVSGDVRKHFDSLGISTERMLGEGIDLLNEVAAKCGNITFSVHLCRGNNKGHWMAAGGYQAISKQVFPRLNNYHKILLEYDSDRAGNFEPLKDVPDDKVVVLGLISTKDKEIEDMNVLTSRVDEASKFFNRKQFAMSTQCGFASVFEGNPVTEEIQRDKLKLVSQAANKLL